MKNENTNKKVALGLSGGVDSSVSAYLLKEQGYEVTGIYMQCWDEKADGCKAAEDRADAAKVAGNLGIKFVTLDFRKEYKERVISYFYDEYRAGRTPNPDVMCNKEIKFGLFFDWAMDQGFDFIATGHYARVEQPKDSNSFQLLKGIDQTKDQSYFLYLLDQKHLSKILFPIGNMRKTEVRKIAHRANLHTFDKPDSVGICFIGEVDIKEFLKKRIDENPGEVVNTGGEVIGNHIGVQFYTIGQRHGFNLTKYLGLPLYVIGKNIEKNELIVGFAKDAQRKSFDIGNIHWMDSKPKMPFDCEVRIRHLGELYRAKIDEKLYTTSGKAVLEVDLLEPTFGVSPGQCAVFYNDDTVLGGGIIS